MTFKRAVLLVVISLLSQCNSLALDGNALPKKCQQQLNDICNSSPVTSACRAEIQKEHGALPLVALRDTNAKGDPPQWRCYSPTCLNENETHYLNASHCTLYCTEQSLLEGAIRECLNETRPVELVLLTDEAESQGAVCLDGSPAAYYFRPGSNTTRSWIIEMEGGGWCFHDPPRLPEDVSCWYRAYGPAIESATPPEYLGSSRMLAANYSTSPPRGLNYVLSDDPTVNPEFHNFNTVFIHYCDGASFTGDAEHPAKVINCKLVYGNVVWEFVQYSAFNYVVHAFLSKQHPSVCILTERK